MSAHREASFAIWLQSWQAQYGFAIVAITAAALARYGLGVGLGVSLGFTRSFILFCPTILIVVLLCDFYPGLFATIASAAISDYFFTAPKHSFKIEQIRDGVALFLFIIVGLSMSWVVNQARGRVSRDIRGRVKAEEALRPGEDRYRELVENSEDLRCTHDLQGKLLSVNQASARLLGYEPAELLQTPMRELIAPEYRNLFDEYLARIKVTGAEKGLMVVLPRTGEPRIWEYNNTLCTEGVSSPIVRGMADDITERRRAELALRGSEHRYHILFEKTVAGVIISSLEGQIVDCNDAWARTLGYSSAEQVRGRPTTDFYYQPAIRKPLIHELKLEGAIFSREIQLRHKDGVLSGFCTTLFCSQTNVAPNWCRALASTSASARAPRTPCSAERKIIAGLLHRVPRAFSVRNLMHPFPSICLRRNSLTTSFATRIWLSAMTRWQECMASVRPMKWWASA